MKSRRYSIKQKRQKTNNFLFSLPIKKFVVKEESMLPSLAPYDTVLTESFSYWVRAPRLTEIVVFKEGDKLLVKRVIGKNGHRYLLAGDNKPQSVPARSVEKKDILARVFYKQKASQL